MTIISDGSIVIDTKIDTSGAESDAKSLSSKLGSIASNALGATAKITAAMVAVATGAVAALAKASVEQYAQYEQLVGGVETLFKESSKQVIEYADNAYKTAGLSANEYMATVTSFAASLLQGLGGDTAEAARVADLAIADMSDNANKMGTSMESIQNAYQGFAKQNYTMLDNLKLGYGGTKTEMERLLADAEKLTGIKYEISNFNDIIEAIHVIQDDLDITGTTAKEAATTIEGSFNMAKSAWTNLMTGIADDNADFDTLINNLVDSVSAFGANLLPRIEIAIKGIGQMIEKLLPPILDRLPQLLTDVLPSLLDAGVQMAGSLGNGMIQALPSLIDCTVQAIRTIVDGITSNLSQVVSGAMQIVSSLVDGIVQVLPMLLEAGLQVLIALGQGIAESLPTLIPVIVDLIISMCDTIIENLPLILDVAIDIILALVEGLINALPTLITEVPRIINSFADAIYSALPQILEAGVQILMMLIKGLIDSIPVLVANLPQIILAIINAFTLVNWANIGKNLITNIGSGIKSMVGNIGSIAKNLATNVVNGIKGIFTSGNSIGRNLITFITNGISSMLSGIVGVAKNVGSSVVNALKNLFSASAMAEIGKNLVQGIWNGISNMSGWIINLIGGFADSVVSSIKGFFGIHSPSRVMRDEVGKFLAEGVGVGFENETDNVKADMQSSLSDLVAKMRATVEVETTDQSIAKTFRTPEYAENDNVTKGGLVQNVTIVNPERTPAENARALKKVGRDLIYG